MCAFSLSTLRDTQAISSLDRGQLGGHLCLEHPIVGYVVYHPYVNPHVKDGVLVLTVCCMSGRHLNLSHDGPKSTIDVWLPKELARRFFEVWNVVPGHVIYLWGSGFLVSQKFVDSKLENSVYIHHESIQNAKSYVCHLAVHEASFDVAALGTHLEKAGNVTEIICQANNNITLHDTIQNTMDARGTSHTRASGSMVSYVMSYSKLCRYRNKERFNLYAHVISFSSPKPTKNGNFFVKMTLLMPTKFEEPYDKESNPPVEVECTVFSKTFETSVFLVEHGDIVRLRQAYTERYQDGPPAITAPAYTSVTSIFSDNSVRKSNSISQTPVDFELVGKLREQFQLWDVPLCFSIRVRDVMTTDSDRFSLVCYIVKLESTSILVQDGSGLKGHGAFVVFGSEYSTYNGAILSISTPDHSSEVIMKRIKNMMEKRFGMARDAPGEHARFDYFCVEIMQLMKRNGQFYFDERSRLHFLPPHHKAVLDLKTKMTETVSRTANETPLVSDMATSTSTVSLDRPMDISTRVNWRDTGNGVICTHLGGSLHSNTPFTPLSNIIAKKPSESLFLISKSRVQLVGIFSPLHEVSRPVVGGYFEYHFLMKVEDEAGSSIILLVTGADGEDFFSGIPPCDLTKNPESLKQLKRKIAYMMCSEPQSLLDVYIEPVPGGPGSANEVNYVLRDTYISYDPSWWAQFEDSAVIPE